MVRDKYIKGSDILLNLKEIHVNDINSFSSSSCSGPASFYFACSTKHGYMEDPDLTGTIKVIKTEKKKGCYILKVKYKKEESR